MKKIWYMQFLITDTLVLTSAVYFAYFCYFFPLFIMNTCSMDWI